MIFLVNKMGNTKKGYTIVKNTNIEEEQTSIWEYVFYFGLLAILCILAFLIAKYVVRSDIDGEKIPIDTSERI